MRISVWDSRELQAAILGLKRADKAIVREVGKHTRQVVVPEWKKAVTEEASTRLEHRVLVDTARAKVSSQNVVLTSATVGRPLRGGLNPKTDTPAVEFGANAKKSTYDRRSPKGTMHSVTRNTRGQLRPANKKGYVVYPAARRIIPRIAALWVQTVVRTFHESLEGK